MRDELLLYYERELTFLRQMGAEFAAKYPKIASRLVLEQNKCEDPHVERMLEAFAFLAARVHLKIDDEFPEITESLLSILYPHYLRPIPSMSVAQFYMDSEQATPVTGLKLPSGSVLNSRPVNGVPCRFRTCYDLTFWPVEVAEAEWKTPDRLQPAIKASDAVAAVRIDLRCLGDVTFSKLSLNTLRFYLNGESAMVHALYELLSNNCVQILVRDPTPKSRIAPVMLPPDALRPVGFGEDEGMLPYPKRSFVGYRLLQEYFCFPQKFFFIDIEGLSRIAAAGFGARAELILLIAPFERSERRQMLELGVTSQTFRLGCAPIINLFKQTAEPILIDHAHYEYPVIPDVSRRNAMEVFEITEVVSANPQSQELIRFEPFYSYRHGTGNGKEKAFWHAARRPSGYRDDEGTEVYVSLVDLSSRPVQPDVDTLTVRTVCTNRDLPARLPFGNEAGDFELEGALPVKRIVALIKPTDTLRPPVGKDSLWRLISQLSLNYLSLVAEGREALQEILRLYNFTKSTYSEKQVEGLVSLASRRHFARVVSEDGVAFARGTQVEMEFDEEQFVGGGVYLFAAVLEHFLGLYVSMNSFSQLRVRTRQRKELLRQWPPRAGRKILL
ncbi:MAG TPA: type VI secretion system baseplate subunit TssF [Bryobacteraceae bacterium]|nr:type VI secretion system baseplate subunit TssF [Bryobacteraceae bacterium]